MKLADLRKLSIKKRLRIHFRLQNGMECVVTENGLAQVPDLKGIPDFNLEDELLSARTFLLEPLAAADKKNPPQTRSIDRDELSRLAASGPAAAHDEHDEE